MSKLSVGAPGSNSLPKGWHDEIVCHTMRRNRDGSITVIALVNVYDDKGNVYSADRVMKLRKGDNVIDEENSELMSEYEEFNKAICEPETPEEAAKRQASKDEQRTQCTDIW